MLPGVARAYIAGASRDGHFSASHRTLRISQVHREWLDLLQVLLATLGKSGWIYRESRERRVWTLETSYLVDPAPDLHDRDEVVAFVRGYFDAEGGVPRRADDRFYVQFCQKDRHDLAGLQRYLDRIQIRTGTIHNPSARIDPEYWRLYVSASDLPRFAQVVGSWHPIKGPILASRFAAAVIPPLACRRDRLGQPGATTLSRP